jgi:hypothetical protein
MQIVLTNLVADEQWRVVSMTPLNNGVNDTADLWWAGSMTLRINIGILHVRAAVFFKGNMKKNQT